MTIVKWLAFLFALGAIAANGPAHADALSESKTFIDSWVQTLEGMTVAKLKVSSEFPNRLKAFLETQPCHSKTEVAKVEAYIHEGINKLQHAQKVKIDYGLNTECRPVPGQHAAKGQPLELRTAARVWIRGYQDYHASMDTDAQGCTNAQKLTTLAKACIRDPLNFMTCKSGRPRCCTKDNKGQPVCVNT